MSALDTGSWYRIYCTIPPRDTYCLVNDPLNSYGSAGVRVTSCDNTANYVDQWRFISVTSDSASVKSYTIRSRNMASINASLSIYTTTNGQTYAPYLRPGVPDRGYNSSDIWYAQLHSSQNNTFYLYSVPDVNWYLNVSYASQTDQSIWMISSKSSNFNQNTLGDWRFVFQESANLPSTSGSSPSSTANPSPSSTQSPTPSPTAAQRDAKGLTTAAKAGIGIGAVVGALLITAAFLFIFKKRFTLTRKSKQAPKTAPPQIYSDYTQVAPVRHTANQKYELSSQSSPWQPHKLYNGQALSHPYELEGGHDPTRPYS